MDRVVYLLFVALFKLLSLLPLRILRLLGAAVGDLLWLINSDARKITEENLSICFPHMSGAGQQQLARRSLQHLGMMALEVGPVWLGDTGQLLQRITRVRGKESLDGAMAEGRGVIALGPHIGNWEILGLYLAAHYPITNMYQPPDHPALDRLVRKARTRSGSALVPTNTSGVKALLRALKRGEIVGILPDQVPPADSGGEFAPFFGIPALTVTLAHSLQQRTGAPVIIAYAKRIAHSGDFEVVFTPADAEIYAADELTSLTAMNRGVEAAVADAPAQYQWEYKRFRKQPGGARKYYLNG